MKKLKRIVVKVGTSTLTQGGNQLSRKFMLGLASQLSKLHENNFEVILVSSGAICAGKELLNNPSVDRSLPKKQMFASIGQVELMLVWKELFGLHEIHVAQILLTRDDISNRKRYLNARDTLNCLLQHRIIPVINENDTVATKEIRVGDNDNLAALVSNLVAADLLILLTDQEGLFTADPRHNPDAKLIPLVKHIDDSIMALAKGASSSLGTGGMFTKVEAAKRASQWGTPTIIASSKVPNILLELIEGKAHGTLFQTEITSQESRKRWLLSEKPQGVIEVDEGATDKILHHGASLLPSGVAKVRESFDRGAIVHLLDSKSKLLAVGITNYGKEEIEKIMGVHSKKIEDILGYSYGGEIIHRTNMTRVKSKEEELLS